MAKLTVFLEGTIYLEQDLEQGREYILGRGTQSDIILQHPKVSRQHLKLIFENDRWTCQVLAKYGHVMVNGHAVETFSLTEGVAFSIPPFEMKFAEELQRAGEVEEEIDKTVAIGGSNPDPNTMSDKTVPLMDMPNDGDEHTRVSETHLKVLLVRLDANDEPTEEIPITEGRLEAGRSSSTQLQLKSAASSRHQFVIVHENNQYVLQDLKSSNGTCVNGEKVPSWPLQVGDIVSVGEERFRFEIHNMEFQNLPALVNTSSTQMITQTGYHSQAVVKIAAEQAAFLQQQMYQPGALGPVNFPPQERSLSAPEKAFGYWQNPKVRLMLLAMGVLAIIIVIGNNDNKQAARDAAAREAASVNKGPMTGQPAFDRLTPEQKRFIEETYNLAHNLYITGKYELAALEVAKIFQTVDNYKDAKEIQARCQQALEIKRQQDEILRMRQEQATVQQKVNDILDQCDDLMKQKNYKQIDECVAKIGELDPDNERGQNMLLAAHQAVEQIQTSKDERIEAGHHKAKAEKTFTAAMSALKAGNYREALKDFQQVMHMNFADPKGIKKKAAQEMASVKGKMQKSNSQLLQEGKAALEAKDYSGAMDKYNRALASVPDSKEAKAGRAQAISELHEAMKDIYSESVIEENLGNIESAKKKWRQIISKDAKNDNYYEKARLKLQKYER